MMTLFSTLLAQDTFFGTIDTPEIITTTYGANGGLVKFISNMLIVLVLGGGLFALFNIIMAGFIYLSASGDPKAHEKVLGKLNMSLLGLALMVMAPALMAISGYVLFRDSTFFLNPQINGPSSVDSATGPR